MSQSDRQDLKTNKAMLLNYYKLSIYTLININLHEAAFARSSYHGGSVYIHI